MKVFLEFFCIVNSRKSLFYEDGTACKGFLYEKVHKFDQVFQKNFLVKEGDLISTWNYLTRILSICKGGEQNGSN
ncbi:hypothetical protein G3A_00190 [Bacillus sp. 17376]|uniref:hypothetical protein n=1 Tax=Mesobacillus boroniphilus TaxID=308892 RepID=UPI0003C7C364|nr:hypothetical protein [Mesobacillus boroniphilus]ESU34625.1 hypothetical protein G3A_00190 [Bacillus sp. 17376]